MKKLVYSAGEEVEGADLQFLSSPAKVVLTKDLPELALAGGKVGPLKAGQEAELAYWMAEKLVELGFAKFKEEITLLNLSKVRWRETMPSSRQVPKLEKNFYCVLRRFLRRLAGEGRKDPSKLKDYERAVSLSKDIINCRVRKIASLAAAPAAPEDLLENLSAEEAGLYGKLRNIIHEWKKSVLGGEGG